MNDVGASDDDDLAALIGQLADEFTERLNRGEQPDVEEFARRHPEAAAVVRQVLPTLQMMRPPLADATPTTATTAPFMPACLGEYRIIREIGRGGMGIVYEAEQASFQRRVALKVLPLGPSLDSQHLARFQREAKTAAALHHTNIVPVFDVGCVQGVHFYVMQFIDGQGLDRLLGAMRTRLAALDTKSSSGASLVAVQEEQARRLAESLLEAPRPLGKPRALNPSSSSGAECQGHGYFRAVARMGIQVAEALEYAHQRGVIHRDIKPSNLILDRLGIVWITDFGLVKCLEEGDSNLTRTGDVLGTARYMSPEQVLGMRAQVGRASDVYSLGATIYELLTLRRAFDAADPAVVLQQIAFEEPPAPRQLNRSIPRDLETIVLKAMAKQARDRYSSAANLAADLQRFTAGEAIQARPLSSGERLVKWAKRRPAVTALLFVIVLAILTLTAVGAWSNAELRAANLRERERAQEAEEANERERQRAQEAEDRERLARRYLYAAHLNLVHQAWERGHTARMRTLLDGLRPRTGQEDLRGFEWFYFWRQCHRERCTLHGHPHVVSSVAFAPDGRLLATGSYDRTIKLWNPATGELRSTLNGHLGWITALTFAPDGRTIFSASHDRTVKFWDPATGQVRMTLDLQRAVQSLAVAPDGQTLAAGCRDGTIHICHAATGVERTVLVGHTGNVLSIAFAPDGSTLASSCADHTVCLWDLMVNQPRQVLTAHAEAVRTVAFSPDGGLLATGSNDKSIKLWDTATGQVKATLEGHADGVTGVVFAPDGRSLASCSGDSANTFKPGELVAKQNTARTKPGEVKLWNVRTGLERATLKGHSGPVGAIVFAPDGQTLATGSEDTTAIVWNVPRSEFANLPGHQREVNSLAFSPDGRTLATVSDDRMLKLWDLAAGQERFPAQEERSNIKFVVFTPDGRFFATGGGDRTIKLWDAVTGRFQEAFKGHTFTIRSIAFAADGTTMVSAAGDPGRLPRPGELKVWDLALRRERFNLRGHTDVVRSVAIAPDGRTFASAGDDRTIKLWDLATGKERATLAGHTDAVRYLAYAADGRTLASASNDQTVKLWDLASGTVRLTLHGHRSVVLIVVFAPDGQTLATGSSDGTVKLWDVVTGQERTALEGHKGSIRALGFSADGTILATGDNDWPSPRIKLWYAARER